MEEEIILEDKQDFYSLTRYENIAILRLGRDFLFKSIDLSVSNCMFDVIDHISKSDKFKVVVIMNCREKIGREKYIDFCRQVMANEFDRKSIHRMCNVFDQLISKIVGMNKLIIHADCGEVIPLFLSISLACDYRIVATHTIFQKPYFELETLPKGGGPFFLFKMLGYDQTKKLLMSEKDINASEALEIGIVDQVVPYNKLVETAIQIAQDMTKRSMRSLVGVKRLINYNMKDIKDYLDFESIELLKTVGSV